MSSLPMISVKVIRRVDDGDEIVVLELAKPDGGALPPFSAGSHIDVEVPGGLIRQYSLAGSSTRYDSYVIAVLREVESRGGSKAMHELFEGQEIKISEPRNHFELDRSEHSSLLFAGGIGVTPILCMATRLSETGADFTMHYCGKSRRRMAFLNDLEQGKFASRVKVHFDDGADDQRLNLSEIFANASPDTHVYVCGPAGYMKAVLEAASRVGIASECLHREFFAADKEVIVEPGGAFRLKVASTGEILDIPADRSVLDMLLDHGIEVPSSCEAGVCGTCVTRVIEGIPDHRDFYMNAEEHEANDQFTPCCSRSKSPLLIVDL